MSIFSGIVDIIFGSGSSDQAISAINNYTGVNLDFGLSSSTPSTTPTVDPTKKSDSFFSPTNILGGLGIYSQIAGGQDKLKAEQSQLDQATAAKLALSDKEFAQQKELLALKASLAGGGGGGGGGGSAAAIANAQMAYDAKKTRYLGIQDAMKNRQEAQGQGSSNIIQAIKNLTEAAQRPLSR